MGGLMMTKYFEKDRKILELSKLIKNIVKSKRYGNRRSKANPFFVTGNRS